MMPEKKEITYEELMSVHRQESGGRFLVKLSSDFYELLSKYLMALEERCSGEKDIGGDISGMLLTQLKRAQEKSAEIYELRMRKIALMAMTGAFGAVSRLDHATPEEIEAFNTLKEFFIDHHKRIFGQGDVIAQEKTRQSVEPPAQPEAPKDDSIEEKTEESEEQGKGQPEEIVIVRILENLPAFAGADRNYQLKKEDLISLPRNIAEILVRHNKAVEIKHSL